MRADAVGTNCSLGPDALRPVVERYLSSASVPVLLKPNAGLPRVADGKTVYDVGPDAFADSVADMVRKGVRICGGCCGTTPDYIRALDLRLRDLAPVPLSEKRRAQRGFNQSELIGARFSGRTGIPMDPNALMKVRHTKDQVGLNAEERRKNLLGSFAAEENLVRGKRVLLLDDVMTTGSTFAECTSALLAAGADSVNCISAATTAAGTGT